MSTVNCRLTSHDYGDSFRESATKPSEVTQMKVVRTIVVEVDDLSERIKQARLAKMQSRVTKMTHLAQAAKMSTQNWYRIEGGVESIPEETLRSIEAALGVTFGVEFPAAQDDSILDN
jgi:DNA-binding Xre family transcriptional regulator